ncbi:fibronectin type III domain-containing protein [Cohnella herbarum]|uniref:Uncharacterized protein n=1 Tax=Cohnella herbarum TaxID=2728023 RepID=A0A7Z2VEV2_9BACL|nr:fibronectin type III domain-containing protein [Cohnella herbarum]QJD81913.1 hypothetical protein HH215_01090 [Cohnella herbarum]
MTIRTSIRRFIALSAAWLLALTTALPSAVVHADPPDTTAPAAITDLAVTDDQTDNSYWKWSVASLRLSWTAPGDDGSTGTATSYDIRYSTAPITDGASWNEATQVVSEPKPAAAGTSQNMIVRRLKASTTYYFAMKTTDKSGNVSAISNVGSRALLGADGFSLSDGSVGLVSGGGTKANLVDGNTATAWGATSYPAEFTYDFGYEWDGRRSINKVRVYESAGTGTLKIYTGRPGGWTLIATDSFSGAAGQKDIEVNILTSRLRFVLESPSGDAQLSEIGFFGRGAPRDETPPSAIDNLAASALSTTSVQLTWTAPGNDNDMFGFADGYDVRYSTSPITDETSWNAATQATGEPNPSEAGSPESMTVSGLTAGLTYHFAIKSNDKRYVTPSSPFYNTSQLSNIVSVALGGGDTTAPAAITSLSAGSATGNSITLSWIAPGDDGMTGTATSYDIRYRTSSFTNADWASLPQASGVPAPAAAGSSQSLTVTGLSAGTTYYFAIKTKDEASNESDLSNVVSLSTTAAPDTTAPAAITSLSAGSATANSIKLSWIAPGDDGMTGTATSYDIRYRTSSFTNADWASLPQASGVPAPAAAGSSQSLTVTGLSAGTTYYFAIKTKDEASNESDLSNVVSLSTTAAPDTTAPAAITSLSAGSATANSIKLSWIAPGDDGMTGTATSYDIRYRMSSFTNADWASLTQASGVPAPAAAGSSQSFTVTGLSAGTTYYFAIKTKDKASNESGLSNVASLATSASTDTIKPNPVTNLKIASQTGMTVTLNWTATGDDGSTGTATSYEVRYINLGGVARDYGNNTWQNATVFPQSMTPKASGQPESLTVAGLRPGRLYSFAVVARDKAGNASNLSTSVAAMTPWDGTGDSAGFIAEIYDDAAAGAGEKFTSLYGRLVYDDFNLYRWDVLPGKPYLANKYAARITGQVIPQYSQTYTFYVKTGDSNDHVRFWVNRQLLVDTWNSPTVAEQSATIALTANQSYEIRVEYYSTGAWGTLTASWSSPSQPRERLHAPRTTALPDTIAPTAIANAAATALSDTSVKLTFTAPYDDDLTLPGKSDAWGRVSGYEVRYGKSSIDSSNWSSASKALIYAVPRVEGTGDEVTVRGLRPGTTYYFAIKSKDEAGNYSPISNTASAVTTGTSDNVAPGAITSLSASNAGLRTAQLSWTAQGDDGAIGTASSYDIRFGTSPITDETSWSGATRLAVRPNPVVSGTGQTATVNGLSPNMTYYFAIRSIDDVGNVSALSNVPSLLTTAAPAGGYVVGGASSIDLHASLPQAGTIYYAVYNTSQGSPTAAAVKAAALGSTGGALVKKGTIAVTAGNAGTELLRNVAGLADNATYYVYWVGEMSSLGTVYSQSVTLQVRHRVVSFTSPLAGFGTVHYLAYQPEDAYRGPNGKYPMLLFLHGSGESGTNIELVKTHGPPMLISQGQEMPFIVISPQLSAGQWFTPGNIDSFVNDAMSRFPIDPDRVYVTGLSIGGAGTFYYAQEHPEKVAAAIPIASNLTNFDDLAHPYLTKDIQFRLGSVPLWGFANAGEPFGREQTEDVVQNMVASPVPPVEAKVNIYQLNGHGGWTETYADPAIYAWLLQHSK